MRSVIRIVKRKEKVTADIGLEVQDFCEVQSDSSSIARTVKSWIAASRDGRAEAGFSFIFKEVPKNNSETCTILKKQLAAVLLVIALGLLVTPGTVRAQQLPATSGESLTLEQAIDLALRNNHSLKIARLAVDRVDDDISAAKTFRLPSLHAYAIVSENLASNERRIENPAASLFPGFGPFFILPDTRKPTAIIAAAAVQPLSQQYQIGLRIKLEKVSRDVESAKLRQEQHETIDQVKKAYYSILQTHSALDSVEQAVKSYQELDKVTGDYVVQKVSLKADHLVVQTRLAKVQYEQLELSNRLATQKEQLNSLLGREVTSTFEVSAVPEFVAFETDLAAARQVALEKRPELEQARLRVQQATLDRRIKKSEYIPDVSAAFAYMTPRGFDSVVPTNFANVGVAVKWEIFDWGRKKHQLSEKDKALEQAKTGLKETEDKILIDVGDKLRKLQQSGQLLKVAKLGEVSAQENLRVSTGRYKFQAVMLSDVLQSQASLAEASHEYQQALLAFWTARAEFEKALGEEK